MLTPRENFLECRRPGGHPDRFVKQYEPFHLVFTPQYRHHGFPAPGQGISVSNWGVTLSWPKGQPGVFPVSSPGTVVCPDVEEWRDTVHMPDVWHYPEEE